MTQEYHNIGKPGDIVRITIHRDPNGPEEQCQDGEVIVVTDTKPTERMCISATEPYTLVAYVPTLDEAKQAKWDRVKRNRRIAQAGGCDTQYGRVQTEGDSLTDIHRAALAAIVDPTKMTTWTMMDNSLVDLNADEIKTVSKITQERHEACHAKAIYYRGLIEAAATLADLDAIDVSQDWPD